MLSNNIYTSLVIWYKMLIINQDPTTQYMMDDIFIKNFTILCGLCKQDRYNYVMDEINRLDNECHVEPLWCPIAGLEEDCKCSFCYPVNIYV